MPADQFLSIQAVQAAVERCTTMNELNDVDELSKYILNLSTYVVRVQVYSAMDKRFRLILDTFGEGKYAEKKRAELAKYK